MDAKEAPKELTLDLEFTKDGKMLMKIGDKTMAEGTYKVEGDKIMATKKKEKDGKEETDSITVKSITDDTMS